MGEYADIEIERQIRETGQRMAREHERKFSKMTRKQRGQAIAAENEARHQERLQGLADAQTVIDGEREALASRGLEVKREGHGFVCVRGQTVIGRWRPDRARGQVAGRGVKLTGTIGWLIACFKAVKPAQDAGQTTRVEAVKP